MGTFPSLLLALSVAIIVGIGTICLLIVISLYRERGKAIGWPDRLIRDEPYLVTHAFLELHPFYGDTDGFHEGKLVCKALVIQIDEKNGQQVGESFFCYFSVSDSVSQGLIVYKRKRKSDYRLETITREEFLKRAKQA